MPTPAWRSSATGGRGACRAPPRSTASRLDRAARPPYLACMDNRDQIDRLRTLAARIDELVERVRQLDAENQGLRQQHEQAASERAQLLAKNEQARSRVEAMIARLKSLEQHT